MKDAVSLQIVVYVALVGEFSPTNSGQLPKLEEFQMLIYTTRLLSTKHHRLSDDFRSKLMVKLLSFAMEFVLQHVHRVHAGDCNYRLRNLSILDACNYLSFSFTDLHLIDLKRDDFISQGDPWDRYIFTYIFHTKINQMYCR